jgi:hypothetical protein
MSSGIADNKGGAMRQRFNFTWFRAIAIIALLVLLSQLGLAIYEFVRHALVALPFPFPLEYGEGAILDQVLRLARGEAIYRAGLSGPPFTLTGDPPLFQLVQTPFARLFGPAFWYGRAIALIGALLAALFIGLTLHAVTGDRVAAAAGGLTLLAFPQIMQWSALDHADSLALALSWAGLFVIVRWPDRRRSAALAAALFAAAFYTRLAYGLVAPVTALAWLLQGKRYRHAAALAAWLGGIGLTGFLALNGITAGGFSFNLGTANAASFSPVGLMAQLTGLLLNAWLLALGAIGFMVVERWWYPTRSWPLVTPYVLSAAVVLLFVDRSGAGPNLMYQLAAALCLAGGAVIAWPGRGSWLRAGAVLLLALQVNWLAAWSRNDIVPITTQRVRMAAEIAHLAQIVQDAAGPVLADEYMGLLPAAGRPLYLQPAEFAQLQRAGRWDASPLIAAIGRREFSAILLYEPPFGDPMIVARWPPAVRNAIWANYEPQWWAPTQATLAYVWVYVPRK